MVNMFGERQRNRQVDFSNFFTKFRDELDKVNDDIRSFQSYHAPDYKARDSKKFSLSDY